MSRKNYFSCPFPFVLFCIVTLWIATVHSTESKRFTINKCCPKGQQLFIHENGTLGCRVISLPDYEELSNETDFDSFPIDLIVNATTLKIHQNHTERYLQMLKENYEIKAGVIPNCSDTWQSATTGNDSSSYYFILYDNLTLRYHIAETGYPDAVPFEKVTGMDVESAADLDRGKFETFPLDGACIDFPHKELPFIIYCPCMHSVCIRKCCHPGEIINQTSRDCQEIDTGLKDWRPQMEGKDLQYHLLNGYLPKCEHQTLLKEFGDTCSSRAYAESDNQFEIFPNGSLKVARYADLYSSEEYCGEVTMHENGVIYEQNLLVCIKTNGGKAPPSNGRALFYGIMLIFGGICLVITVSISIYLPELRRKMHNKIALSHNISLMVACFVGGIAQLYKIEGDSCILLGSMTQFSFLGSFFWMNVMCIDISMAFSSTRSVVGTSSKEYKKFLYYSLYAWGLTAIITMVTIYVETLPQVLPSNIRPGFTCYCSFNTKTLAIFIYFYGPMAVILAINLFLFIFTTVKIMTIQRQTAILHKTESSATGGASYQSDKQRLILYAKLFLLMGLSWVTEILSWAIGGPEHYWYFTDGINLFRAVFIFILFICKRPVLNSLKRRLNKELLTFSTSTKSESFLDSKDQSSRITYSSRARKVTPSISDSSKRSLSRASKETQILKNKASTDGKRSSDIYNCK